MMASLGFMSYFLYQYNLVLSKRMFWKVFPYASPANSNQDRNHQIGSFYLVFYHWTWSTKSPSEYAVPAMAMWLTKLSQLSPEFDFRGKGEILIFCESSDIFNIVCFIIFQKSPFDFCFEVTVHLELFSFVCYFIIPI